jgi:hypothetical protein
LNALERRSPSLLVLLHRSDFQTKLHIFQRPHELTLVAMLYRIFDPLPGFESAHLSLPNVTDEPRGVRHKPSSSNEKAGASGLALCEIDGPVPALALAPG